MTGMTLVVTYCIKDMPLILISFERLLLILQGYMVRKSHLGLRCLVEPYTPPPFPFRFEDVYYMSPVLCLCH